MVKVPRFSVRAGSASLRHRTIDVWRDKSGAVEVFTRLQALLVASPDSIDVVNGW